MNPKVQSIMREMQRSLKDIYGERLVRIMLFGSHSRGDATPGSDIDALIVLKGAVKPGQEIARTGGIASELSLKHDVVISCTFVSAERYETEQSPLLINVRREGVAV
jgi:predicted nucleotidyltransferase